jgi:hypothetical protein
MTANHLPCQAGDGDVRRGEAVIRGDGRTQRAWHKDCFTLHRAVRDIEVPEIPAMPLTQRLEAASAIR